MAVFIKIMGGLGNQLHQYAFAFWLKSHGLDVLLDISHYNGKELSRNVDTMHNGYELNKCFKTSIPIASLKQTSHYGNIGKSLIDRIGRKLFGYKKTHLFETAFSDDVEYLDVVQKNENVYLEGYWCTFRYADELESLLRKELVFPPFNDVRNINALNDIRNMDSVAVHVRRGDKLNIGWVDSEKYYETAIHFFMKKYNSPRFFCFSDDITWCIDNLPLPIDTCWVDWNSGGDSFRDMQLMKECKGMILATSTFSTWAAWMNDRSDKTVIIPAEWEHVIGKMQVHTVDRDGEVDHVKTERGVID